MPIELPPQYDPKSVEKAIYQKWLDARAFHAVPDARPPEKRYSIVIPPPNVTGALHLGHAINGTIQDVLARYHRMRGDNTMWMPGIDHAGIATQAVVEKSIFEREHKTRHDLGREELVKRIWAWKEQFGTRILNQLQSIGASCDWDRTRFTLDDICAKAVREAFFKMFKDGLIFRGKRLVNWDTHLQTAVADDEIYHEAVKGQMTSIKYPVDRSTGVPPVSSPEAATEYLIVATTRPETMLGDTAVAVHPDDPRYKHLHGKFVIVPLVGRKIPVICDGQLVDPKFGTGVVKVTPAHDPNDYATGVRHNLEQINLLTPDGKVNDNGQGEFLGKKYSYVGLKFATAARKQVLADLEALDLIADKKPHEHEVGHSDRSKTPIEPYMSDQWFVRMGDIAQSEPRPLGSDHVAAAPEGSLPHGRGSEVPPHSNARAYFITFHTYATWLHGQEPGAVDPEHNEYDTPFIPPNPKLVEIKLSKTGRPPLELSLTQRQSVLNTLLEVAAFRGWTVHAVNVRTTHVHIVVSGNHAPERMMNDFKSYATRRMVEAALLPKETKAWSRHGSTRYLWKEEHVSGAVQYTLHGQGENAPGTSRSLSEIRASENAHSEPRPSGSDRGAPLPEGSLPHGRGSDGVLLADGSRSPGLAQAAIDAVTSGRVKITPDRYAKGYVDWLAQKRDWCISRQLWWGHRIPVWSRHFDSKEQFWGVPGSQEDTDQDRLISLRQRDSISIWFVTDADESRKFQDKWPDAGGFTVFVCAPTDVVSTWLADVDQDYDPGSSLKVARDLLIQSMKSEELKGGLAVLGLSAEQLIDQTIKHAEISKDHVRQLASDPANRSTDVRALLDQMGFTQDPDVLDTWFSSALWPISTMGWPANGTSDKPEDQILPYFYPTSLLSTAREILTLWVARMVIFSLYCRGDVPFKDVYIHAVIQDGEGRPMKKTLGNGVDPVDIVHSHGADALRFTLASMATETQDIRLPVQLVCPRCHERIPNNINGPVVIGCPKCKKHLTRPVQTAVATAEAPMSHSTSDRFDLGRNFANKIWNAARYILSNITDATGAPDGNPGFSPTHLEDRWILSRLSSVIEQSTAAINNYRFSELAQSLYHFFWTDLCDWYLEIAKPRRNADDAAVQSILLHCLETTLKLLHPLMPFITEEIWSKLPARQSMLILASWPEPCPSHHDADADAQIGLLQELISQIRDIQNRYPKAKGANAIFQPQDGPMQTVIERSRLMIESLANIRITENHPDAKKPADAVVDGIPGRVQIFIPGVIDKSAETAKLTKRQAELEKFVAAGKSKLANAAAVAKAPPQVVQGWRDQLAKQEEELAAVRKNLAELA